MSQTKEAQDFIQRIVSLPKSPKIVHLDSALKPSIDDEAELRRFFATDKTNPRLSNPLVGLVDVFDAPPDIRITRARVPKDDEDLSALYVMPLDEERRRKEGTPAIVNDLADFKKNWSIFTESSLSQLLDWNNVVAAGGAVLACLTPLPETAQVSKRAIRKHYHSAAYPTSDVDLFLYGMTPEQAEKKIVAIYEAVRDSVPWDVTCVRTKHTVSIHSQYPYRSIQIILRLYQSPAEILAGFDIDAPCCAYNGDRVYANPRAIVAMMRQCNTVDMTRRSPSYEVRLTKYSSRDFEVYVTALKRADIDPTIFERSISRVEGLARLLVLEKLTNNTIRESFINSRRSLRGRPSTNVNPYTRRKRALKGDLKGDTTIGGLEMNDYDVASLHIPYGPGWDSRRVDKLIYQTDLGMNSTFNPKNKDRRLHRHPAFFGTMAECLEDCCEHCPEPLTDEEKTLQEEEDKQYIRGRIAFIEEDPGRQSMSGSFNPIDVGEWSAQVFVGPTERFFNTIAAHDRDAVSQMIKKDELDVNRRDYVGRAPLHMAIISKAEDIACDLIDAGARMMARLVDGRTSLHLAAQYDLHDVVKKLLERSAINKEQAESGEKATAEEKLRSGESDRPSSKDDWSSTKDDDDHIMSDAEEIDLEEASEGDSDASEGDEGSEDSESRPKKRTKKDPEGPPPTETAAGEISEDADDEPDVLDVNLPDWDLSFTPLMYAVLFAGLPIIETLLTAGADPKLFQKANAHDAHPFHPLTLTLLAEDEDRACKIAERLVAAGATSSTAGEQARTIFQTAVSANKVKLVSTLLRRDPGALAALNFPTTSGKVLLPVVLAIGEGKYAMASLLIAYGAKLILTKEDISRTLEGVTSAQYLLQGGSMENVNQPLETAVARYDDIVKLLLALGVEVNVPTKASAGLYNNPHARQRNVLDWLQHAIKEVKKEMEEGDKEKKKVEPPVFVASTLPGWKGHFANLRLQIKVKEYTAPTPAKVKDERKKRSNLERILKYLTDVESLMRSRGAKTWDELNPPKPDALPLQPLAKYQFQPIPEEEEKFEYVLLSSGYSQQTAPIHQVSLYDELFEASFTGNNQKIQQLCLPNEGLDSKESPIQISVRTRVGTYRYDNKGYTPLFAAVSGRKWETARLIMAIVAAQYKTSEETAERFSTRDIALDDDDSDGGSEDSEDSSMTVDQINFTDISKRPSKVQCNVTPTQMLHLTVYDYPGQSYFNLLKKAVADKDLEAYTHISDLYKSLPESGNTRRTYQVALLNDILVHDVPDILDEYIRRTGDGIDVVKVVKEGEEAGADSAEDGEYKIYLGLNVHGKKRTDLAKKNDPNAVYESSPTFTPLLAQAAGRKSINVVKYLAGDRVAAAYRFYASSHSTPIAERIRSAGEDFEKVLPEWLGVRLNRLGESPLVCPLIVQDLKTLEALFENYPKFMKSVMHERVKFAGLNLLSIAVFLKNEPAVIDFLLAKGISPIEVDQIAGHNILHMMALAGQDELLEHVIKKLPKDTIALLLNQQSKTYLNTPLHAAVTKGHKRCVELIMQSSETTYTLLVHRNTEGSTPLHIAVQSGFSHIVKTLVSPIPVTSTGSAAAEIQAEQILYAENGVGETPLDMASLQELLYRTRSSYSSIFNNAVPEVSFSVIANPDFRSGGGSGLGGLGLLVENAGPEVKLLRETVESLIEEGRLQRGVKMTRELLAFSVAMEAKVATAIAREADSMEDAEEDSASPPSQTTFGLFGQLNSQSVTTQRDSKDVTATLTHMRDALAKRPGHLARGLVHLVDVQKSVQGALALVGKNEPYSHYSRRRRARDDDDDDLEADEDEEAKEKKGSLVLHHLNMASF